MKIQPTEQKKISANKATDKGLISKIYTQLLQLNIKTTNPIKKMGETPKEIFLQTRHIDGQHAQENMLNTPTYQRNANQNHNEVSPYIVIIKKPSNKCWRGCGEKGTLLHCWWECKLIQPL